MRLVAVADEAFLAKTAPPGHKVLYLIRHGQSLANAAHGDAEAEKSPELRDARLSELGIQQATELQSIVPNMHVELVVASPLTRAMQTACLAFDKEPLRIVVHPHCTEFFSEHPSCQGRNRDQLQACPYLNALPRFSHVNLEYLHEDWWSFADDEQRLVQFLQWFEQCHEDRVAVVCHWGFIRYLLNNNGYSRPLGLGNCSFVETVWSMQPADDVIASRPATMGLSLVPHMDADHELPIQIQDFLSECRDDSIISSCNYWKGLAKAFSVPVMPHVVESEQLALNIDRIVETFDEEGMKPTTVTCAHKSLSSIVSMSLLLESQSLARLVHQTQLFLPPINRTLVRHDFHSVLFRRHATPDVHERLAEIASSYPLLRPQSSSSSLLASSVSSLRMQLKVERLGDRLASSWLGSE